MVIHLKAEARNEKTKAELNELRSNGKVPGVIYGRNIGTASIAVEEKELLALLRSNPHAIVEMEVPEIGTQPVMIHEVQRDKLYRNLLHIDFHQINMDKPVKTTVRLEMTGDPIGVKQGGILQIQLHEIEVKCLPAHIPSEIKVDLSQLDLGNNLVVGDLHIAPTVEVRNDPNDVVATILTPQKEAEKVKDETGETVSETVAGQEEKEAVHKK